MEAGDEKIRELRYNVRVLLHPTNSPSPQDPGPRIIRFRRVKYGMAETQSIKFAILSPPAF